jgi:hypothetical protein
VNIIPMWAATQSTNLVVMTLGRCGLASRPSPIRHNPRSLFIPLSPTRRNLSPAKMRRTTLLRCRPNLINGKSTFCKLTSLGRKFQNLNRNPQLVMHVSVMALANVWYHCEWPKWRNHKYSCNWGSWLHRFQSGASARGHERC